MSLFGTLAHEGTLSTNSSRRGLLTIVGAALVIALGLFAISKATDESPVVVNTISDSLAHQEEFIRLNTTALDALAPAAVVEPLMDVDPFLYWNTTALDALAPAAVVEPLMDVDPFLYWNTTALEYPQTGYVEPESGPR